MLVLYGLVIFLSPSCEHFKFDRASFLLFLLFAALHVAVVFLCVFTYVCRSFHRSLHVFTCLKLISFLFAVFFCARVLEFTALCPVPCISEFSDKAKMSEPG